MNEPPILELRDLQVHYGASYILQKVCLQLDSGMTVVIGRNGMGKTTMMRAIMGQAPITGGSIRFKGEEIAGKPAYQISNLGIGYVPQGRMIFSTLTVDEQLRFCHRPGKDEKTSWDAKRVYDLFPRLAQRKNLIGTSLSGGEQQMLAIGRALVTNPSLLLMDEPSEGLAPVILDTIRGFIGLILESGVSILLIEQNLPFVKQLTDQVKIMVSGQIAYSGSLTELLADEALTAQYLITGV